MCVWTEWTGAAAVQARGLLRRLAADQGGATAVEFALVAPLLLVLLLGSIETGRYIWFAAALDHAVSEAARCAEVMKGACATPAGLAENVGAGLQRLAVHAPVEPAALATRRAACGTLIRVALPYPSLVPGLGPALPALDASACIGRGG
ncbi:TadE/TadG family type IV pilus assembly protein [Thermaurantiacus sp.]